MVTRESLRAELQGRLVLAPLTRGGNLPYRRLCAELGAHVTFSEMAHAPMVARRDKREMVLLRRHPSEPVFGVQIAARDPEVATRAAAVAFEAGADLVDVNCGCPIDGVVRRGLGAALLEKPRRLEKLVAGLRAAFEAPITVKIRSGYREGKENAPAVAALAESAGADAVTVHGRTREQRYRRPADWDVVARVAASVGIPVVGNGDVLLASDALARLRDTGCAAVMAARGALIKPWIFEDFAHGADRPRTGEERLAIYRRWVSHALEHWGDDEHGFVRLRAFLEFHVDWWRRYVPEDAAADGAGGMQSRTSFEPRDALEAVLAAPDDEGIARACELILEAFDPPTAARRPSAERRDASAGGWS
jgi:tRNA-dihydrouridine synthase 3